MFPKKTEFKTLEEKSTRLSGTHNERHSTVHSPVWDTEPRVFECGENAGGKSTTAPSHIPLTRLLWCKGSLDLRIYSFPQTTFLVSPPNIRFSRWGPYSQATYHPTAKAIRRSMFISSLIPKSLFRKKPLPQSTCTCGQFLWVGWHFTVCWLKLIAQQGWSWMQ